MKNTTLLERVNDCTDIFLEAYQRLILAGLAPHDAVSVAQQHVLLSLMPGTPWQAPPPPTASGPPVIRLY